MSKEREMIEKLCSFQMTYSDWLLLIADAEELLAQPEQEPVTWISLSDIQWINIVNDPKILELTGGRHSFEDAVSLAIVMTEEKCKVNNSNSIPTREPLSEDVICEILLKKEWKGFVELVRQIEKQHKIGINNV